MKKSIAFWEGIISVFSNIFLFIIKLYAGIVTNSVALMADAWHTLSDSFSSIIVIVGNKISEKPADEEHPYGHGRAEMIAAIIIGVLLSVVAFSFGMEAIEKLQSKEKVEYGTLAIVVTIISILVKEGLAQYAFWGYRKTKTYMLKADAWHHRSDAISSAIILAGIFLSPYFWWIDGVLGIIVAAMILYAAYEIIMETSDKLLGEVPDNKTINNIIEICDSAAGYDTNVHHTKIHRYGKHTEITFHVELDKNLILEAAHEIATEIEKTIKNKLDITATVHIEPNNVPQSHP